MHSVQNNMQMTAAAPRLRQPKLNTKKKMIIYITLAAVYLLAVLIAGVFIGRISVPSSWRKSEMCTVN